MGYNKINRVQYLSGKKVMWVEFISGVGMGGGGGGALRGLEPPLISDGAPHIFFDPPNYFAFTKRCFVLENEFCVLKKLEPPHRKTSSYATVYSCII